MHVVFSTTELFLIACAIIFTVPYVTWRLSNIDYYAPLFVVQIIAGVFLGPAILGRAFPEYYAYVFDQQVIQALNGIAWWAVMIFVWIAGIELDLKRAWQNHRDSAITATLALSVPLILGGAVAAALLLYDGWAGPEARAWQFVLGVGMACAVTALPILIVLMDKMEILRQPIGQRVLCYASLDDIAIWGVLAVILMDWQRAGTQAAFLLAFGVCGYSFRKLLARLPEPDRWHLGLIWLAVCSFGADWSGLHFMVGAFLAGVIIDGDWIDQQQIDQLRRHVLLLLMPVFFLSTGLKTDWSLGGVPVLFVAALLLVCSVGGKLLGVRIAGRLLNWQPGEAAIVGWLLQTKALIMIIFANILMDKNIISHETFTSLLLMAVASTMLTVPMVSPKLGRSEIAGDRPV